MYICKIMNIVFGNLEKFPVNFTFSLFTLNKWLSFDLVVLASFTDSQSISVASSHSMSLSTILLNWKNYDSNQIRHKNKKYIKENKTVLSIQFANTKIIERKKPIISFCIKMTSKINHLIIWLLYNIYPTHYCQIYSIWSQFSEQYQSIKQLS
jgi:hypothetical protein